MTWQARTCAGRTIGGWAALTIVTLGGCAQENDTPSPTATADAGVLREFLRAVESDDRPHLRSLAGYISMDDPATSGEVITGDRLPIVCLEAEVDSLKELGVSADSPVEFMSIGGAGIEVDGDDSTMTYGIEIAQIGLPNGQTVGRGIIPLAGGSLVQMEPNAACEQAIAKSS
jgi:hypothetical protein